MKAPAYQWYPKDILSSARVAELDLREECAYRRALDFCWLNGSLPNDAEKLSRIIGKGCTKKIAVAIIPLFKVDEKDSNRLVHDRLEQERSKQKTFSDSRRKNANNRWQQEQCTPDASALQVECETDALQFPSTSTIEEEKKDAAADFFSGGPESFDPRPSHAPKYEDVLEYFIRQGHEQKAEAFFDANEAVGWVKNGDKIINWQAQANGWIRKAQKSPKPANETGKKPKASGYVYTEKDEW